MWEQFLCNAEYLAMEWEKWVSRKVCCMLGRTVWFIYMCSSTLIYLLFTESIHTVHPQISMTQLVAPSQTVSEMLDGHTERWEGWTSLFFKEEATESISRWWLYELRCWKKALIFIITRNFSDPCRNFLPWVFANALSSSNDLSTPKYPYGQYLLAAVLRLKAPVGILFVSFSVTHIDKPVPIIY